MKIIIASGGTLGHLTPIFPIIEKLNYKHEIILYTTKKQAINDFLKTQDYFKKINYYETKGINKKILNAIKINLKAYKQIKEDLKKESPDLIIGMGGYISGIIIKASKSLNIKTIIYEQNSILGTANKLSLKYVDKFLYSYQNLKIPKKYHQKKEYLINPRMEYSRLQIPFYQKNNNQILITSGSLGSKTFNETLFKMINENKNYHFIMITGTKYYQKSLEDSKNITNLTLIPSTTNLIKYIIESKIVISRAGATTINEIIGANTLGIFIPSPNVTANHQEKNTKFIKKYNLGIVLLEKDLNNNNLERSINHLLENEKSYLRRLEQYNNDTSITRFIKIINEIIRK